MNIKIRLNGEIFGEESKNSEVTHSFRPNNSAPAPRMINETAEVIDRLNKDELDPVSNMSSIDMLSRIPRMVAVNISVADHLPTCRFLPLDVSSLMRQVKRNLVSIDGLGREEITKIAKRGEDEETKKLGKIKQFYSSLSAPQQ